MIAKVDEGPFEEGREEIPTYEHTKKVALSVGGTEIYSLWNPGHMLKAHVILRRKNPAFEACVIPELGTSVKREKTLWTLSLEA